MLAGASMGAHTLLRFALEHPERVAGLVVITPAYVPEEVDEPERLARWDALADGLERGGVEGFVEAYGDPGVPAEWLETVMKVLRQRLSLHEHPEAVADALRAVPRSRPFGEVGDLAAISAPDRRRRRPRRGRPGPPAERRRGVRARHPRRAAGGRGGGTVPGRLAGRAALEGDRRARGRGVGGRLTAAPGRLLRHAAGQEARLQARPPRRPTSRAPEDFEALLGELPDDVVRALAAARAARPGRLLRDGPRRAGAPAAGAARRAGPRRDAVDRLAQAGIGVPTDMTEDVVREVALPTGLVDTKVCAIDDTWSGLRLVIRKELR